MEADSIVTCLNKEFGTFRAVEDVSFSVAKGEFFSILGPSGCGKTTLLRMIAGFEEPSSGDLLIGGRRNPQAHRRSTRTGRTARVWP